MGVGGSWYGGLGFTGFRGSGVLGFWGLGDLVLSVGFRGTYGLGMDDNVGHVWVSIHVVPAPPPPEVNGINHD